jgi:small multidrug resistance pump/quaternary ammonium compound-resistance protein SugE
MGIKILLAATAALCFAGGGMLMKPSEGLTRLWPSVGVFALFALGAALNIVLVRIGEDVGPAYLAVAGAETVVALFLAWLIYGERVGASRLGAAALITVGVVILSADPGRKDAGAESVTPERATAGVGVPDLPTLGGEQLGG